MHLLRQIIKDFKTDFNQKEEFFQKDEDFLNWKNQSKNEQN